jgi:hypothetical protein
MTIVGPLAPHPHARLAKTSVLTHSDTPLQHATPKARTQQSSVSHLVKPCPRSRGGIPAHSGPTPPDAAQANRPVASPTDSAARPVPAAACPRLPPFVHSWAEATAELRLNRRCWSHATRRLCVHLWGGKEHGTRAGCSGQEAPLDTSARSRLSFGTYAWSQRASRGGAHGRGRPTRGVAGGWDGDGWASCVLAKKR